MRQTRVQQGNRPLVCARIRFGFVLGFVEHALAGLLAPRRIAELSERVRYLEEQFRLAQLKRYAPRSEKSRERVFNEAEHEAKADPGTDERTVPLLDTGLPQEAPRSPEP